MRALKMEFALSDPKSKDMAHKRTWNPASETVETYFYNKYNLLTDAFENRMDQAEICDAICEGLPLDFRAQIRTPLSINPKPEQLRRELMMFEYDYKSMHVRQRGQSPSFSPSSPTSQFSFGSSGSTRSTAPSSIGSPPLVQRQQSRPPPLKDSYDPSCISQQPNPLENNKVMQSYLLPDNATRIYLVRNCKKCGEGHFNFEHDAIKSPPAPDQFRWAQSVVTEVEGYPAAVMPKYTTKCHQVTSTNNDAMELKFFLVSSTTCRSCLAKY